MDMHDTSKLNFYVTESYRNYGNAREAYDFNNGYLEACLDFMIIEYPKFKELKNYNEKLYNENNKEN